MWSSHPGIWATLTFIHNTRLRSRPRIVLSRFPLGLPPLGILPLRVLCSIEPPADERTRFAPQRVLAVAVGREHLDVRSDLVGGTPVRVWAEQGRDGSRARKDDECSGGGGEGGGLGKEGVEAAKAPSAFGTRPRALVRTSGSQRHLQSLAQSPRASIRDRKSVV